MTLLSAIGCVKVLFTHSKVVKKAQTSKKYGKKVCALLKNRCEGVNRLARRKDRNPLMR